MSFISYWIWDVATWKLNHFVLKFVYCEWEISTFEQPLTPLTDQSWPPSGARSVTMQSTFYIILLFINIIRGQPADYPPSNYSHGQHAGLSGLLSVECKYRLCTLSLCWESHYSLRLLTEKYIPCARQKFNFHLKIDHRSIYLLKEVWLHWWVARLVLPGSFM